MNAFQSNSFIFSTAQTITDLIKLLGKSVFLKVEKSESKHRLTDEQDVVSFSVGGRDLRVDGDGRELGDDSGPDDDRRTEERRNRLVHQRVGLDEVQVLIRKRFGVVVADPRTRIRNLKKATLVLTGSS